MNKTKKYIVWSIMFILISSLATTEISHANKLKDFLDKLKSKYHTEVIPVTSAGEDSHSGEAYTIIPRVDKKSFDYSGESGVRYLKKEDPKYPGDKTKQINKSITYQVVSKGPYPKGKISWRTDRILVSLSIFDEGSGYMIPVGFWVEPIEESVKKSFQI